MTAALRPGTVYVSWGRVDVLSGTDGPPPRELLSEDELARAERMADAPAKRRFVAGRVLLRTALGRAAGVVPRALRFQYGERGKPFLPAGPSFSLSHSGDRVVVAVAAATPAGGRVGVDVEVVRPVRRMEAVAQRRFAPEEVKWWAGLPSGRKVAAFFQLWTRKEAFAKALGRGLAVSGRAFAVATSDDVAGGGGLVRLDLPGERADRWSVVQLECGPGAAAAVAAEWPAAVVTPRNTPCR